MAAVSSPPDHLTMAEVVPPEHCASHEVSLAPSTATEASDLDISTSSEMANPMQPRAVLLDWQENATDTAWRHPASASMRIDIPPNPAQGHKRATSTLPSFSFNASDTSGRHDAETPPQTPEDSVAATPSRGAHRRGGSEYVGGDSRLGLSNALSSSPAKNMPPPIMPPPPGRRGHAHRRSAAISNHDVAKLMQPTTESQPRLSSSLPNSPLDFTSFPRGDNSPTSKGYISDPFGPELESQPARPPSRPRVGFSDNVEFIPRPLSTISSETESSLSTIRGHSVNDSISSVLSLSTPSPPSARTRRFPLPTSPEDDVWPAAFAPSDSPRRVEREGHWLKQQSSENLDRPMSESAANPPRTTFVDPAPPARPRKRSFNHALGFDRRRSEPSIGLCANEPSRLSAISLQEAAPEFYPMQDVQETRDPERKSSARRVKEWAAAKISKKAKEVNRALTTSSSSSSLRPTSAGSGLGLEGQECVPPVAETDLDAVLGQHDTDNGPERAITPVQSRVEVQAAQFVPSSGLRSDDYTDSDAVLDLDAALGPFKTPPIGSHRQRKEMHSSRLAKDFSGPGGHYHRRAESAPNLSPFEYLQEGNPSQSEMADVFEEEEEDLTANLTASKPASTYSALDKQVESDFFNEAMASYENVAPLGAQSHEGLGIQEGSELERPLSSSFGHARSMIPNVAFDGRGSSIIEETILEEATPAWEVEIVEAHEEPRASSLTKSSDSSDTPTMLAPPTGPLSLPSSERSSTTPETYHTSTYSSPIMRPGSLSSSTTGEHVQDLRLSVEVPSLTSSRSTMISSMHGNGSRRDIVDAERASSVTPNSTDSSTVSDTRRKRGSIQSLTQLMPFATKTRSGSNEKRPQTSAAAGAGAVAAKAAAKKENRLKKLKFWKTKQQPRRDSAAEA